jgi:photosystem II stability/assembly factor-like uncharacterized protein
LTLNGRVWTPVGPSPISLAGSQFNGLISAIAINPSNPSILYIGTAGGGLWRSIDGGLTWIPLFDRQLSLGIGEPGALAIDPNNTNIVYVGTSSRINREPQAGLFKSIDGGSSWIRLGSGYPLGNTGNAGQFFNQCINVIIVDPSNINTTLYLASNTAIFRSTDGGLNWIQGNNSNGDVRSLALDTSSTGSRILYAGISGRGVFRSNDGGLNWTQILSQTTPSVATALGSGGFGKVVVDIAPPTSSPNPSGVQIIYASLAGTGSAPDPVGIFISTDQGATWSQQTGTGIPTGTQGGYSFHMAVDPSSPGDGINDIIYFGCVGQGRSNNSGNNFTNMLGLHADTHAWAFVLHPSPTPSTVYCGNDGGLFKSTNGGTTWTALNSGGLQLGLVYNMSTKSDATGSVQLGALQDNGIFTTDTAVGLEWKGTQGGDGWDVAYDGIIAGQVYCTSGFWSPAPCTRVWRSTDEGLTFPFANEITPWGTTSDAGCYLSPIATDPSTGGIVYVSGSQNLWQSFNSGNTWRIISTFANAGHVDVSRINGNYVVFATGIQVFVTVNALASTVGPPSGVTFIDITRNLPPRNVARVSFDPNDPSIIYAVLSGFNGGPGNIGHVFRTSIGASSWTDISPNIDAPFNAIALDGTDIPSSIYTGTEFGVLRSVDGGSSWSVLDDIHFPRVPVLDLELRNGVLRAGTYGRGAFAFVNRKGPAIAVNLEHNLAFGTIRQGPQYLTLQVFNVGLAGGVVEDLVIGSVQRLMGSLSYSVLPTPSTPLVVPPGEHIGFTVMYNPTGAGVEEIATIRIVSNDPTAPFIDLSATGMQEAYD